MLFMAATPISPSGAAAPERVVSLNLCVDHYLLAIADRRQIAALTLLATDPAMSATAAEARGLPQIRGTAEEVIRLAPDLVLAGGFARRETQALLRRLGYRIVDVPAADTIEAVRATTRAIAALLGREAQGERLVAALDDVLAVPPPAAGGRRALYLQRRGFVDGERSLVSEMMAAAGLRNVAAEIGLEWTARVDLEIIVTHRPELLLVDSVAPRLEDDGSYLLRHPALLAAVPRSRWIAMPQMLVHCGGPTTAAAITHLRAAVAAVSGE
ncbi:MAG: ABC transporter substrate-binding protein [Alphaproteobacteria bacterium]